MTTSKGGKTPKKSKESLPGIDINNGADGTSAGDGTITATTGKYLVLFREDGDEAQRALAAAADLSVASTADFEGGVTTEEGLMGADALLFDKLGVALVNAVPDQIKAIGVAATEGGSILAIEPERIVYALSEEPFSSLPLSSIRDGLNNTSLNYLLGYRDAINHLVAKLLGEHAEGLGEKAGIAAIDETELTWGLQVTKVASSRYSGRGIRIAVLDTGFDFDHPDFFGRQIQSKSFIDGQAVQDGHGHGTHCIGTACGSRKPGRLPRYGIAYEAEIYAGKVLSNQGSGADGGILNGINWAITNRCQIISMSLGAVVQPGQGYSLIFEQAAQRALAAGTLIIAAAGNDSKRPDFINPVSHPANCPSIMAVAALDPTSQQVSFFSNGGLNPQGGQVDIVGPGRNVTSSWPRPMLYRTISGTSMATPHVAGIAALIAQANPSARGRILQSLLIQSARRLDLPARDIGAGLVQAPQ